MRKLFIFCLFLFFSTCLIAQEKEQVIILVDLKSDYVFLEKVVKIERIDGVLSDVKTHYEVVIRSHYLDHFTDPLIVYLAQVTLVTEAIRSEGKENEKAIRIINKSDVSNFTKVTSEYLNKETNLFNINRKLGLTSLFEDKDCYLLIKNNFRQEIDDKIKLYKIFNVGANAVSK